MSRVIQNLISTFEYLMGSKNMPSPLSVDLIVDAESWGADIDADVLCGRPRVDIECPIRVSSVIWES